MAAHVERKLVGFDNFVRSNPMSDRFELKKFHHVEFWCSDALNTSRRFTWGLGMQQIAKSDMSTGNTRYASAVVQSDAVKFVFTAPYSNEEEGSNCPHEGFSQETAHKFVALHGLAVRALAVTVGDARRAFEISCANGGIPVTPPYTRTDADGKTLTFAEMKLVDDCVLRYVSGDFTGPYLPGYESVDLPNVGFGLGRIDHCVHNVPNLLDTVGYVMGMTGFHEFAEFVASDIGTLDSGLNSMVLSNNDEFILMPFNEPTHGTKRKSQIQTFLEQNNGSGLQHIALKTDDIFHAMREMRKRSLCGGFEFMAAPNHLYYERCPDRIGKDVLTAEQWVELEALGILADKDDQGVLLQVFTKPLGDRMTIFIELIQRVGCMHDDAGAPLEEQKAGCGGFGKGNFGELFKSIEDYEKSLEAKK